MEARAMQTMTIGKAAREAGVNIETIRFYERRGLIERPPKGNGYRVYSPEEVARIRFIKEAQQIGFSLSEIGDLLSLRADPAADCSEVRRQAVAKLDQVNQKIEQLRAVGVALETLIAACPGRGALQACSILDALTLRSTKPPSEEKTVATPFPSKVSKGTSDGNRAPEDRWHALQRLRRDHQIRRRAATGCAGGRGLL
jgi:MerR family transcriptional regulator, copper efflux regulator